jgi:hypothetical protein
MSTNRAGVDDSLVAILGIEQNGNESASYQVRSLDIDFLCLPPLIRITLAYLLEVFEVAGVVE